MAESGRKSSGGCLRGTLIGCGVFVLLAVVAGIGVATNLDLIKQSAWYRSISGTVEGAKVELHRSLEIREALLAEFPAEQIGIHLGTARSGGKTVRTLAVSLESPKFEFPEDRSGQEEVARRIARTVARLHPEIGIYDRIGVRIVRRFGVATVSTSADEFEFPVDELIATGVESGAEAGAERAIGEAPAPKAEEPEGD